MGGTKRRIQTPNETCVVQLQRARANVASNVDPRESRNKVSSIRIDKTGHDCTNLADKVDLGTSVLRHDGVVLVLEDLVGLPDHVVRVDMQPLKRYLRLAGLGREWRANQLRMGAAVRTLGDTLDAGEPPSVEGNDAMVVAGLREWEHLSKI